MAFIFRLEPENLLAQLFHYCRQTRLFAGRNTDDTWNVIRIQDNTQDANGGRIRHVSAYDDDNGVLSIGAHGGSHLMLGEYDIDIGDVNGFIRKVTLRVSAGIRDIGVQHNGAITSVQDARSIVTDAALGAALNFYAPAHNLVYVLKMTSGLASGTSRWILSNTATGKLTLGLAFFADIAIGDTYEIHSFTTQAANSAQFQLWHGTDVSGNALAYLCMDIVESLLNTGFHHRFEATGATFRDYLSIVPNGDGTFNIRIGAALSSIFRDIAIDSADGSSILRISAGRFAVEFNAGILHGAYRRVAVDTQLANSDHHVKVDTSAALRTITLQAIANLGTGREYWVKNRPGANNVNVVTAAADTFNGAAGPVVVAPGTSKKFLADDTGTNWETF